MSEKGGENCSVKSVGMSSREMGGCSPPAAGSILRLVTGGRVCRRNVVEASASWLADQCSIEKRCNSTPRPLMSTARSMRSTMTYACGRDASFNSSARMRVAFAAQPDSSRRLTGDSQHLPLE